MHTLERLNSVDLLILYTDKHRTRLDTGTGLDSWPPLFCIEVFYWYHSKQNTALQSVLHYHMTRNTHLKLGLRRLHRNWYLHMVSSHFMELHSLISYLITSNLQLFVVITTQMYNMLLLHIKPKITHVQDTSRKKVSK